MSVFIVGTDTGVGKTLVSGWLSLHTQWKYWKPIQTGSEEGTDSQWVQVTCHTHTYPEGYIFKRPLSPHAAASLENASIHIENLHLPQDKELIVEGAGGVLVPLSPGVFLIDVIVLLKLPVIIVARSGLGTLNHTCLTLEALRARGIEVWGVILNGSPSPSNATAIQEYGQTPLLAEIPSLKEVSYSALKTLPIPKRLQQKLEE
jgi:dethiobiotin synthetase